TNGHPPPPQVWAQTHPQTMPGPASVGPVSLEARALTDAEFNPSSFKLTLPALRARITTTRIGMTTPRSSGSLRFLYALSVRAEFEPLLLSHIVSVSPESTAHPRELFTQG